MKSLPISHLFAVLLALGMCLPNFAQGADARTAAFFADAKSRFDKRDYPGAIIQLKNVLQIDPKDLPALVLLGKSLLRANDPAGAEVTLNEALSRSGDRAELLPLIAQSLIAQGKQKQVFEQGRFSATDLPGATRAQLLLLRAGASADVGELREAMKFIDSARVLDPYTPDSWVAEVPVRIRLRQFKEAGIAVERATAMAPNSADTLYQRASVYHVEGNSAAALAAYDKAIKADPDHIGALLARAGIYIDQKRAADAARDLDELRRISPTDPRAAYLRALLAERDKKPEEVRVALVEITEMLDQVPLDYIRFRPQVLMLNGLAHFGLNEPEKAKVYFEAFQKVQPDAPTAKMLAQIYLRGTDHDRAVDVLEKYLKAQPTDGQAMALLGSALMAKGQTARAASLMQQALQTRESPEFRKVLGLSLMQSGQTGNAIKELETAFKNDPRQIQAATTLIPLYFRSGQPTKAIAMAERLAKLQPANAGFQNLLGMVKANAGSLPAARLAFEQAVKIKPDFTQANLNLARIEIAEKSYSAASGRLSAILKAEPKNAEAMYEMATISDRQGNRAQAIAWLDKAYNQSGPRELRWGLALSNYHLRQGNAPAALMAAKGVAAKEPEDLLGLMALARAQLANKDIAGAKSTLNVATRVGDFNPKIQVDIALMQIAANNMPGALYSLEKAQSKEPDFLPALVLQTDLDLRQGDAIKAEKRAREILGKYPKLAVGHSLLGDIAQARGQSTAAIEAYRRAHSLQASTDTFQRLYQALGNLESGRPASLMAAQWLKANPKDARAHRVVADSLARNGNYAAAKSAYTALLRIVPEDGLALNNLANVLLQLKDPESVKVAEQAVAINPAYASASDTLGWALLQNGQVDRALKVLKEAKQRDPASAEIRYHLAAALAQSGNKKEARDELDLALKDGRPFDGSAAAAELRKTLN
jgi:cellulose synthase operon protein C